VYLASVFFGEKYAAAVVFSADRAVAGVVGVFQEIHKPPCFYSLLLFMVDVGWLISAACTAALALEAQRIGKYYFELYDDHVCWSLRSCRAELKRVQLNFQVFSHKNVLM
jgi:hypothetical protein